MLKYIDHGKTVLDTRRHFRLANENSRRVAIVLDKFQPPKQFENNACLDSQPIDIGFLFLEQKPTMLDFLYFIIYLDRLLYTSDHIEKHFMTCSYMHNFALELKQLLNVLICAVKCIKYTMLTF